MKSRRPFVSIGLVLLSAVLLSAVLVSFSLLSLSTARSDLARTREQARGQQEYHAACVLAEEALRDLRLGKTPEVPLSRQAGEISMTFPIDENKSLLVILEEQTLHILRWQTLVEP